MAGSGQWNNFLSKIVELESKTACWRRYMNLNWHVSNGHCACATQGVCKRGCALPSEVSVVVETCSSETETEIKTCPPETETRPRLLGSESQTKTRPPRPRPWTSKTETETETFNVNHVLRVHDWVHFAHRLLGIVYGYLEFKLRYLRVKELFAPIVLWKTKQNKTKQKQKNDRFLLFLKALSWETDLWVTLGGFAVKKRKIGKGNLSFTKNPLSRNGMWCASNNHNYICHTYVLKNCKIWTLRFKL